MTAAEPVRTIVNPGAVTQRYVLWGNSRIDSYGGAIATAMTSATGFFDRLDQQVARAIWITDWATGKGYLLDFQGGVQQLNGQAALTGAVGTSSQDCTAIGLPYVGVSDRRYVDWSWDPAGSGQFYVLDVYGQIYPVNGAPAIPRTGPRFTTPIARKLAMQWTPSKKAVTLDEFGNVYPDFAANLTNYNHVSWPGWDAARDVAVTDWTTSPNTGYVLDLYGGVNTFGPSASTRAPSGPYVKGADHARTLNVINVSNPTELLQVWNNGQAFDYFSSTPPTVTAGNGVSEVQTVTITGTPTGGTFTLTFGGNTTVATNWNATASTVQTNLRALASIGSTGVTVTGGPGPGTPYVVTFAGALATTNVAQMTSSSAFTGGASPTVTVTTTTDGVTASPANTVTTTTTPVLSWTYSDPQKDAQTSWQVYLYTQTVASANAPTIDNDPSLFASQAVAFGTDTSPLVRGVIADVDLSNQGYKYYVRAKDSSGLWSAWSSRSWTQNVAVPTTPAGLVAYCDQENFLVNLSVPVASGPTTVRFECSDDQGNTWNPVRGADAVSRSATTTAIDYDAPLGITRQYRAFAYSTNPRVASAASNIAQAMLTTRTFVLTATSDPTLGGEINVVDKPAWTRPVVAGVFAGVGAVYPTVVSDGTPKARKQNLTVDCNSREDWVLIDDLVTANSTLVLRDPFGDVVYCRVVGDWSREQQRRAPSASEATSLRHAHATVLPLVQIAEPITTAIFSTIPPAPGD